MGVIEEGVYVIESTADNERFHLDGGHWKWGALRLRQQDNQDKSRNQQFLITLVPGDNPDQQFYHITNLFYGCQVGLFADEVGTSWQVKAAPCTTAEPSVQWGFTPAGGDFNIFWRREPTRHLSLAPSGGHHGFSLSSIKNRISDHKLTMALDTPTPQPWRLVRQTSFDSRGSTSSFLSHITSNPKLSMLNLLSTHQSLALHAKSEEAHTGPERDRNVTNMLTFNPLDNPRCQNLPPLNQLLDGVRVLDFRFDTFTGNRGYPPSLSAWHGIKNPVIGAAQGYSFTACLQTLKFFLERFPSETVIANVTNETHEANDLFNECFNNDARGFEGLFYRKSEGRESIHQINLNDARGKVILTSTNLTLTDSIIERGTFYSGNGAQYSNEDAWDKPPKEWPQKLQNCRDNMNKAKDDKDESHVYATCWNMSNAVSVPPYNPIDFYFAGKKDLEETLNEGNLGKDGEHRTGVVTMDFYELSGDQTLALVRSNQGCADVSR